MVPTVSHLLSRRSSGKRPSYRPRLRPPTTPCFGVSQNERPRTVLGSSEIYWRMPIPHLRGECRRRTLPDDGTKPVLVKRLDENDVWRSEHQQGGEES